MNRRTVAAVLGIALLIGSCSGLGDVTDPPVEEPEDSTPAPDATEGIAPGLEEFYTQRLEWSGCGGDFQCSTLTVPLDYDDPAGETIEISVLRSPATGDEVLGSLLVNPGGPGASGIEYARAARGQLSETVLEHYDVVGFDPRGVGESTPIDCLDDAELDEYLAVDSSPDDDAEIAALQEDSREFAAACVENSGDLLQHVGTPDVANDMDVLRAALGDSELYYLGKSYGTFIGARYAEQFPSRVGRMVLDGAMDPALGGRAMALGQTGGFEQVLSIYLTWCIDQGCPLGSDEQSARQALSDLLDSIDSEPLPTGDDDRPLTQALALFGVVMPLYLTADQGYPLLSAALEAAISENDGSGLLTLADLYFARNSDGTYSGNQNEAIGAINCLDRPESATPEQAKAGLAEFEAASPIFGPFLAWGGIGCGEWPVQSDVPAGPVTAAGAAPILVVGTTGDPATPYVWAQALAGQLESGVLLTYEGTVHTAYKAGSPCIDEAVDAYLVDGTPPADDTRCS